MRVQDRDIRPTVLEAGWPAGQTVMNVEQRVPQPVVGQPPDNDGRQRDGGQKVRRLAGERKETKRRATIEKREEQEESVDEEIRKV